MDFIAHENQSLIGHLCGVATKCKENASKIGCGDYGEVLGLLHDVGKYSTEFQNYIKSSVGELDPDKDEDFVNTSEYKGKIDHSTAGAQFIWQELAGKTSSQRFLAQILSLCLVSHHSGLIDNLRSDNNGTVDSFTKRIRKNTDKTHLKEIKDKAEVLARVNSIISNQTFSEPMERVLSSVFKSLPDGQRNQTSSLFQFHAGLFVRFLFSCLIDADRQDTADSEKMQAAGFRQNGMYVGWKDLISRLEKKIVEFGEPENDVDILRRHVCDSCLEAASKDKGIFTLTVPTGGAKTLSSLRFALHHAEKHKIDRIIYVIPFTSIIDQNAEVVRKILETSAADKGRIVLEHHSNIGAEKQGWKEKLLTENWDAPVVYTTMVQFLEALFGAGTRGARRMHQLAESVIVFDEIQTLPIRCVHMFCNAVNFLVRQCGSSIVLCTATQPLLGRVDNQKGSLDPSSMREIMPNVYELFDDLKRVDVIDLRKAKGWSDEETADLVLDEVTKTGSCLVIVNTKRSARALFRTVQQNGDAECFHLSTGMCPIHRKKILKTIRDRMQEIMKCVSILTGRMVNSMCGIVL
ncbi:CRISPR-associated endonuclease Cas3'' [Alkalispirochaeta alkalica]|uniref:CRISPR-associated endonuclease Cas3'' n=1 Tax=Alkalispirochaeta alkalica TaxID=46356 RepID=UPI0003828127|nr:CRISPR-associated endonuclease Cas3'' [Alkalispirochaeta alkalica]